MAMQRVLLPLGVLLSSLMLTYCQSIGNTTDPGNQGAASGASDPLPKSDLIAAIRGCSVSTNKAIVASEVSNFLSSGVKLIKYNLTLVGGDRNLTGYNDTRMFQPLFWVRSTGRQGTGLLLLPPTYDILSLMTLEYGVEKMNVDIRDNPRNCLLDSNLTYSDLEILIRYLVLNDFKNVTDDSEIKPSTSNRACNMHVMNISGTAEFHFYCCHRDEDLRLVCEYLRTDIWLEILFVAITVLKVLVILYSPRFIPDSMYRLKHVAMPYIHRLVGPEVKLNTIVTRHPEKHPHVINTFTLDKFNGMPNFSTALEALDEDVAYTFTMKQVDLRVKQERLLPEDYAPVSLLTTLYESLVRCRIRERPSFKDCCETDFFKSVNCTKKVYPWYELLQDLMKVVVLIIIALPWLIRMYVYYVYEYEEMNLRKEEAKERNLKFYFPGSVTLYLTPLHALFLFIYILLSLESCAYGVMTRQTKDKFKLVLRKCFRDMREMSKDDVIGWFIHMLLKPCAHWGAFGVCMGVLIWAVGLPVLLVIFSFYMFPTVNITFRLLAHFFVFIFPKTACANNSIFMRFANFLKAVEFNLEMESLSKDEPFDKNENKKFLNTNLKRLQQLIIIILCLISLYSVIFLITEFVSFLVEIFIYTLMGLILNAGKLLTYFSLIFLLVVYANDCYGTVTKTFLAFNKTMNGTVLGLGQEKVHEVIYEKSDTQKNIAFRMKTERSEVVQNPVRLIKNPAGLPRWEISRLLLFLSNDDKPMIPSKFFFKSCKMSYYSVPGELLMSYLRATAEFGLILLFLLFVLVVVLAFGDTYGVSATNKLLATVAGGFVPFMLRKIVFKSHTIPAVDTSSIHFQICLTDLIADYSETWPIFDIHVGSVEKTSEIKDVPAHVTTETEEGQEANAPLTAGVDKPAGTEEIELTEISKTDSSSPQAEGQTDAGADADNKEVTTKPEQTPLIVASGAPEEDLKTSYGQGYIDILVDISNEEFEYKVV